MVLIFTYAKSRKPAKTINITLKQPIAKENTAEEVQSFIISGFSEDGQTRWQVVGESADIFSETVDMRTIEATSHSKEASVVLTAEEGTFFKSSKDVELRKHVIANTDEGTTLTTDKLKWLAETETIVTDDYVHIKRGDFVITGKGAKAAPRVEKVQLDEDVKMIIYPTSGTKAHGSESITVITCDGPLETDYKNNISYFYKNVVIEDKEGKIFADKLVAYIDPEKKVIRKAEAFGNVKIVNKHNISYSEKAVYLANEGRVILAGKPKVVIYSADQLSAEKGNL